MFRLFPSQLLTRYLITRDSWPFFMSVCLCAQRFLFDVTASIDFRWPLADIKTRTVRRTDITIDHHKAFLLTPYPSHFDHGACLHHNLNIIHLRTSTILSITKVQVHAQHHLVTGVPANHTGADPGQAQGSWPLPYTMAEVFFFSILHIYTCSWFFSGKIFYRHFQVFKKWKISNADQIRATWNQFCAPIPFLGKKIIEVTLLFRCTRNHTYSIINIHYTGCFFTVPP